MRSDQPLAAEQPIKIAILAMGGEGGGVLADWIVALGEANGYIAQTTSVPGVAQRTGATIYYVELFACAAAERAGRAPVLALMPLPGDVDIVLASELMEAGRAVQRGLVTPERTTLIASTHRVYAISEKTALGDGRASSAELLAHGEAAAQRFVRFDMAEVAEASGSVISAVLFGALAGTGALPFARGLYEATIERGGVGVQASLRAFAIGFERAAAAPHDVTKPSAPVQAAPATTTQPPATTPSHPELRALVERLRSALPAAAQGVALEGLRRLVDYQDPAYAALYLERLERLRSATVTDAAADAASLLAEAARHLALWMSYEDTIRVAELKTRASRFERVHAEVRAAPDQIVTIHEFMHPRMQEICDTLPAALGRRLSKSGAPRRLLERFTRAGRVVETTSLRGFLLLAGLAALKRWRRGTLRYAIENERIEQWLRRIEAAAKTDVALATELALCQRLVKGYGETHERGWRHFEAVMAAADRLGAALRPAVLRELRDAALADEQGDQLRAALAQHAPLRQAA